jgi:hypothetical protein
MAMVGVLMAYETTVTLKIREFKAGGSLQADRKAALRLV